MISDQKVQMFEREHTKGTRRFHKPLGVLKEGRPEYLKEPVHVYNNK
jgi:hypothetical protein